MSINEAIIYRIKEVCELKDMSICDISLKAGKSPSSIYDLMHNRTKHSKINTIQRFCEGAGMTLGDFFSNPVFDNLDPED
ncbi:MAG: helix-turn-helix transcriptional regulator [Firmicutes bacterium]|nr:helix-turn-helix transcriptional regulator [Bacillota bacterium]